MCQRLIAFATEFMQPEEDQTLYKQLISASTHQPTSVKDVTSPATVDRIDSNLNAMISDAQPSQSRRCHNCGAFDHYVKQCPYRILCPRCNQLGHIAENCDLYLAPSNSVLGKSKNNRKKFRGDLSDRHRLPLTYIHLVDHIRLGLHPRWVGHTLKPRFLHGAIYNLQITQEGLLVILTQIKQEGKVVILTRLVDSIRHDRQCQT